MAAFLRHPGKPLRAVTMADLVAFADSLAHLAPASRARALGSVKSLAAFGHRIGHLASDVAAPVRLSPIKRTWAERILGEGEVHRLLALETHPRNHALLRLLYAGALRVSELCALSWRDLQPRDDAGLVTVFRLATVSAALRSETSRAAPAFSPGE